MPFHLELGSDGKSFKGKAIVVNSQSGKHFSMHPLPMARAKAQMRLLEAAMEKEGTMKDPKKSSKEEECS
jgi:hypothetical protein